MNEKGSQWSYYKYMYIFVRRSRKVLRYAASIQVIAHNPMLILAVEITMVETTLGLERICELSTCGVDCRSC